MRSRLGLILYWLAAAAAIVALTIWAAARARGETAESGNWKAESGFPLSAFRFRETQCGPYGCRVPQGRPLVWLTPRVERPSEYKTATVRIANRIGAARSIGSGVLVRHQGRLAVLTAAHLFSDGVGQVSVTYANAKASPARLRAIDRTWDMALLGVDAPGDAVAGIQPAELAGTLPKKGDLLESCGFGHDGRFAVNRGTFVAFRYPSRTRGVPPDWIELTGRARLGDSGGPIFNERGRLAGLLFGTDNRVVNGVSVGRLRLLLERAIRPADKPPASVASTPRAPCLGRPGCLLPRRPAVPAAPPQVNVTVGAEVRQSLEKLENLATQRNGRLEQLVENTTPPEPDLAPGDSPGAESKPRTLGVVLAIAAAVGVGLVLFYSTQSHTPI